MPAGSAQSLAFSPAAEDPALLQSLLTEHEQHYKAGITRLPAAYKKDYAAIYQQRWDHIKTVFDKKEIYTEQTAQQYLDALVAAVVKANPVLQDSAFHCYFSRSGVPNASYLGEGLILFNMGLFCKLENESQAAFVICHEIAHYFLQHSEHSIEKYVSTLNSEAVQKELRRIKRSEYGKRALVDKLVKGLTFGSRRHSRDHEAQADSMAVELMRHTPFDITGALTALGILDRIDTDTLNTAACLAQLFHAKEYPFREKWIAREEGLLGGHAHLERDSVLEDSLKTHPDCRLRIQLLEPVVNRYQTSGRSANPVDGNKFAALRHTFAYEIVEYAYVSDNYTRSLYHTIALLQQHPEDPYLVTQAGRILNGCYAAQKAHTLGKRIELPSPGFSPGYNLLLQFIQNLYPEDFAAISYYYLHRHVDRLSGYPAFTKAYNTSFHEIKQ
ncbi:M48 family metalloprotease [Chitinophaga japonensis]|nr:M48 family metalloprotease [Chitinophaga japonensis]